MAPINKRSEDHGEPATTAHIINHTHWDREWFLTSVYTSQWIPDLVDNLEKLVADNPNYMFLLDGQTLVIEDLLTLAPNYRAKVQRLVENNNLIVGPYYCQPDWQITGGELLVRNMLYGWQDMQTYGGANRVGWLVDTFGHISQTPQLHRLFNLEAVYVWRGVPQLEPYFQWQSADGQSLFTINLFGGYRNLYGITHAPEVAVRRLEREVTKLQPFYPTQDIPLFDGYDLEQNPEDPVQFYRQSSDPIPEHIRIEEAAPAQFADKLKGKLQNLPRIIGELSSGKYGAIFPGTLSARTYLKIMQHDCEHMVYQLCEPLAALARLKGRTYNAQPYETWGRMLLQNAVHDCICGVSVDQVHEKMELSYQEVFDSAKLDILTSLEYILKEFVSGVHAVSTNPFPYEGWQVAQDKLYHVQVEGIGVWQITEEYPIEKPYTPIETFTWHNEHYTAVLHSDGGVQVGSASLGYLVVSDERGDTYSDEAGEQRSVCQLKVPSIIQQCSEHHCVVHYDCSLEWDNVQIAAVVRLIFDQTPLIRWHIDLDSHGTNFKVEMVFETAQSGEIYAGMPFDVVQRTAVDRDLLPRQLEGDLAKVLLGQRELEVVQTFPFHDFVAVSSETASAVVFAKGIRAYQATNDGRINLTLRRSVEWLTKPDLPHRSGDAGPLMYVPDACCERMVHHEIAVVLGGPNVDDLPLHQMNAGFQNPPLIVEASGGGEQTEWSFLQEHLPLTSLHFYNGKLLARFFNPTNKVGVLDNTYQKTDVWGNPESTIKEVLPKHIVTVAIEQALPLISDLSDQQNELTIAWPEWRVGDNQGQPDISIIEQLETTITQLEGQLVEIEAQMRNDDSYRLQHQYYILKRELYEVRLSVQFNRHKLAAYGNEYLYEPDPNIVELGTQLNQLRIKRRIYDYVVEAL